MLLAGPPLLAATVVHSLGFPTGATFTVLSGRLTDTAALYLLTAVTLLAWARFLLCVLVETAAALARRTPRRIPLIAGVEQAAARHLVAAMLGLVTGIGGFTGTAAALSPLPAHATVATAPAEAVTAAAPTTGRVAAALAHEPPGTSPRSHPADTKKLPRYVVQAPGNRHHDSLSAIADRYLGNGLRWKEIYALNKGRPQPDGGRLELARLIRPGWILHLPADATDLPAEPSEPDRDGTHVVVEEGDTLWAIAEQHLGDPRRRQEIFDRNRGRTQPDGSRLTDPDRILPGLTLDPPSRTTGTTRDPLARPAPHRDRPPAAPPATPPTSPATPAASSTPTAPASSGASEPEPAEPAPGREQPGVDLPGGWVSTGLAAALSSLPARPCGCAAGSATSPTR